MTAGRSAILLAALVTAGCAPFSAGRSAASSEEELCANLAITGSDAARTELLSRHALTLDELRLANAGTVTIGMRSLVVICGLGKPTKVAAEQTTSGSRELWTYVRYKKWVGYPTDSKYKTVSIEDGKVVAFQQ